METLKLPIMKAKPKLSKPYTQQMGRQVGEGAGHIVTKKEKVKPIRIGDVNVLPSGLNVELQDKLRDLFIEAKKVDKMLKLHPEIPEWKAELVGVYEITWKDGSEGKYYGVKSKASGKEVWSKASMNRLENDLNNASRREKILYSTQDINNLLDNHASDMWVKLSVEDMENIRKEANKENKKYLYKKLTNEGIIAIAKQYVVDESMTEKEFNTWLDQFKGSADDMKGDFGEEFDIASAASDTAYGAIDTNKKLKAYMLKMIEHPMRSKDPINDSYKAKEVLSDLIYDKMLEGTKHA